MAMMTQARLRLAADGNTELLETFWNPDLVAKDADIAPPLLIYADLMANATWKRSKMSMSVFSNQRSIDPERPVDPLTLHIH
jgi:hypothetical protein